jgi:ABC-type lipoprotein export system ATPase subunit
MSTVIAFKNVNKENIFGNHVFNAKDKVNFSIDGEEFAVILGPSGEGKSTIPNILEVLTL